MTGLNEIELVQKPIITHQLESVGVSVKTRLDELNLKNLVATPDTIQTLKKLRAELNKEHAEYKSQWKIVSDIYMEELNAVKPIFKANISELYDNGEAILKTAIGDFENMVKDEKKKLIVTFFNELILSEKIDFITFENVGIDVKLSDSDKSLKDKCSAFVSKVVDDISLIETNQYKVEIMVEYKKTLNVSKAIKDVQDRKEAERQQAERNKIAEIQRRERLLSELSMIYIDMVKLYEYHNDSSIYITLNDVENLSTEEFSNKLIRIEESIKEKTVPAQAEATKQAQDPNFVVSYVASAPATAAPLQAPVVETKPEIVIADFRVSGTIEQLKELGAYMKSKGIIYTNI